MGTGKNRKEIDTGSIASAGLRVLLIMKKNTQGGIFLNNVNTEVMEILKTTGFDSVFLEHTDDN